MSSDATAIVLPVDEDDDDIIEDEIDVSAPISKTNLDKRRVIDNYLEEKRLQKKLGDYDFDFDFDF